MTCSPNSWREKTHQSVFKAYKQELLCPCDTRTLRWNSCCSSYFVGEDVLCRIHHSDQLCEGFCKGQLTPLMLNSEHIWWFAENPVCWNISFRNQSLVRHCEKCLQEEKYSFTYHGGSKSDRYKKVAASERGWQSRIWCIQPVARILDVLSAKGICITCLYLSVSLCKDAYFLVCSCFFIISCLCLCNLSPSSAETHCSTWRWNYAGLRGSWIKEWGQLVPELSIKCKISLLANESMCSVCLPACCVLIKAFQSSAELRDL